MSGKRDILSYTDNHRRYNESRIVNVSMKKLISNYIEKERTRYELNRQRTVKEYKKEVKEIVNQPVVQQMKKYRHHSNTSCYEHCIHVSYYNYIICQRAGLDKHAAAKGGLLHDLFLYDWHKHVYKPGERKHGFEHPTTALINARSNFNITRKEGDIIVKHMFPLTITPPMYRESYIITMTDKFCGLCEVMDMIFRRANSVKQAKS